MSNYGPVHPTRDLAEQAAFDADVYTIHWHEVYPVCALYDGDRLLRPAGFIVVAVDEIVSSLSTQEK